MSDPNNPFETPNQNFVPVQGPNMSYYEQEPFIAHQHHQKEGQYMGDRAKNFPPCKPIVHHNIPVDITSSKRTFVRKAYFGWLFHCFCIVWNFICMLAAIISDLTTVQGFIIALIGLLVGPVFSFFVYFILYSAVRKGSTSNYVMWFCMFVLQIAYQVVQAIGITTIGSAGFIDMITAFGRKVPIGIMFAVSCALWSGAAIYGIITLNAGRRDYNSLGGNQAASREFGTNAVNFAYDNRDTIKQVARDNADTIKRVAVENQDTIVQIGSDAMFTKN